MSVLQLVLGLVEALAWPATLVVFLWLFRSPLSSLIGRIKSASGAGFTAEFAEQELERKLADTTTPESDVSPTSDNGSADGSPRGSVELGGSAGSATTGVAGREDEVRVRRDEINDIVQLAVTLGAARQAAGLSTNHIRVAWSADGTPRLLAPPWPSQSSHRL